MIQTDLHSFSYKKGSLVPWCKKCGAERLRRDGKTKLGKQLWKCKTCKYRFTWTSDLRRGNVFSYIIGFAVELYTTPHMAASLRGVVEILEKAFGTMVSHETVRRWVRTAKNPLSRREKTKPTVWHIDETYFKIKGIGHWLWIVYSRKNRQVLAWHISKLRTITEAKRVLKNALEVAGKRPLKIITDGLKAYNRAIKKIIGWNWREHKKRYVIDSGIGKNALIERLNREIKRRIKWFSTFQSEEGANAFFAHWFYHFNSLTQPD